MNYDLHEQLSREDSTNTTANAANDGNTEDLITQDDFSEETEGCWVLRIPRRIE